MQKFLNNVFAFGDSIPHEQEIGVVLIVLGIVMILYFQMEPSIPAREVAPSPANVKKTSTASKRTASPAPKRSTSKGASPKRSPSPARGSVSTPSGER